MKWKKQRGDEDGYIQGSVASCGSEGGVTGLRLVTYCLTCCSRRLLVSLHAARTRGRCRQDGSRVGKVVECRGGRLTITCLGVRKTTESMNTYGAKG